MASFSYLNVRYEGDEEDYFHDREEEEEEEEEIEKKEVQAMRAAPKKTPTPVPITPTPEPSVHNSQITLNITSDGDLRKNILF